MAYFKISVPRGHVGAYKSAEITFYFKAKDMVSALAAARRMPSVKHHAKIGFFLGKEITREEYEEARKVSAYKRYPL